MKKIRINFTDLSALKIEIFILIQETEDERIILEKYYAP